MSCAPDEHHIIWNIIGHHPIWSVSSENDAYNKLVTCFSEFGGVQYLLGITILNFMVPGSKSELQFGDPTL